MAGSIPADLAHAVARVNDAVAAGDLPLALSLAQWLRKHSARISGPEHAYTQEAYALEAYVAHLQGDHEHAATVSVYLARMRSKHGDPRAEQDALRAATAWLSLGATPTALALGRQLLTMLDALADSGQPQPELGRMRRLLHDRLRSLGEAPADDGLVAASV
ncbi:hypothetical protein ACWEGS_34305 [Streptomyces sp. NPDC004822]